MAPFADDRMLHSRRAAPKPKAMPQPPLHWRPQDSGVQAKARPVAPRPTVSQWDGTWTDTGPASWAAVDAGWGSTRTVPEHQRAANFGSSSGSVVAHLGSAGSSASSVVAPPPGLIEEPGKWPAFMDTESGQALRKKVRASQASQKKMDDGLEVLAGIDP